MVLLDFSNLLCKRAISHRSTSIAQRLCEVVFFLVLDSGNHNVTIGQVSEPGNVAAAAEINDGFAHVYLALYRAKSFWHDSNFLECITNDSNGSLCDIFVLCGQKVMKPLQVCDGLCRVLYGWHTGGGSSLSDPHESNQAMTSSWVACKPVSSKCLIAASQLSCHA